MAKAKESKFISETRFTESAAQREDMILVEGKFYSINENSINNHFFM